MIDGGSRKGSKGNAVRAGFDTHNAAAAPATVSGESSADLPLRAANALGKAAQRRRPASQEICHQQRVTRERVGRGVLASNRSPVVSRSPIRRRRDRQINQNRGDGDIFAVGASRVACPFFKPQTRPALAFAFGVHLYLGDRGYRAGGKCRSADSDHSNSNRTSANDAKSKQPAAD